MPLVIISSVPFHTGISLTKLPEQHRALRQCAALLRGSAVMVSPWANKGTVVGRPVGPADTSEFKHSILNPRPPATLKKIFNLSSDFLTKRDVWAGTFEHIFTELDQPRTDCLGMPTNLSSEISQLCSSATQHRATDSFYPRDEHKAQLQSITVDLIHSKQSHESEAQLTLIKLYVAFSAAFV